MAKISPSSNGLGGAASKTRYILYTRVSTQGQDDNNSHESQLVALQKHVADKGGLIVGVQRETASGGYYLARPGILAAIEALERDEADALACFDFSRYSRDGEHQQTMMKRIERVGKRIEFTNLELSRDADGQLTPDGQLMFGVSGSFASYHRAVIRSNTMRGRRAAAQAGQQPNRSIPPFGYHIVTRIDILKGLYPEEQLGRYFIVEARRQFVVGVFERRAAESSLTAIAKWLEQNGILDRKGKRLSDTFVSTMLQNTVYRGIGTNGLTRRLVDESRLERGYKSVSYSRRRPDSEVDKIEAPRIISDDLWYRCQELRGVPRGSFGENRCRHLLSSVLKCPKCGCQMTGKSQLIRRNKVRVYTCRQGLIHNGADRQCTARGYNGMDADKKVLAVLRRLYDDDAFLQSLIAPSSAPSVDDSLLDVALSGLVQKEERLVNAQLRAIDAGADSTIYEQKLAELAMERRDLQKQFQAQRAQNRRIQNPAQVRSLIASIYEFLDYDTLVPGSGPFQEVHNFLLTFFERLEFTPEHMPSGDFPRWCLGEIKFYVR